jgi:hypothetical protein
MGGREARRGYIVSGIINSLDALEQRTRERAQKLIDQCLAIGHRLHIFETLRTVETQNAYYAQGRLPLAEVNGLRAKAGIRPISAGENKYKITYAQATNELLYKSKNGRCHGNGTAFDVVPITADGKLLWSSPSDVWFAIGEIGELCGLVWGGRWEPKDKRTGLGFDPNHFQLPKD